MNQTQTKSKDEVVDKIQKLLALSSSSNDHEAQAALFMAQKLMVKYNVSETDLPTHQDEKVVERWVMDVSAYNSWVRDLAVVVAENFRCKHMVSKRGSWIRECFVGFDSDATVAAQIFAYAVKYAERAGSNLAQTYNDRGLSSRGIKQDYVEGFVAGLRDGWKKQALEGTDDVTPEQFALALCTPAIVNKYIEENTHKITMRMGHQERANDPRAFEKGHESGKAFSDLDGKKGIEGK
jgi:hypothetical protein